MMSGCSECGCAGCGPDCPARQREERARREQPARLVTLKQAVIDTGKAYEGWALQNTAGKTAAELVEIDLGYRRAERAYTLAQRAYQNALAAAV